MTSTHLPAQSHPPLSPRLTLPTMYDLPSEELGESGLPDEFHPLQGELLRTTFRQEQVSPLVIVELLSPGTEGEDLGQTAREPEKSPTKWQVYEQILRVLYYVVFSRYTNAMQAFCLLGNRYQMAELTEGRLLIPSLELSLGLWQGSYENIKRLWLRWMTLEGNLIFTPSERAEQLAVRLRELGVNPDELGHQMHD